MKHIVMFSGGICSWMPIESAPKDGTSFLAVRECFEPVVCHWEDEFGKWSTRCADDFRDDDDRLDFFNESDYQPSHWMPLPRSPADDQP